MRLEYTLKYSDRRTLAVEITREGEVLVRAPLRTSRREVEAFLQAQSGWILTHIEKQQARARRMPEPSEAQVLQLKAAAKAYLPGRVEHFGALMGVQPTGVKVTSAKKRFGSCNAKNSLCFSWRLMRYPATAIDYVVVHEMAHILHKNHGKAFYACVAQVLPDYKQRWALLR